MNWLAATVLANALTATLLAVVVYVVSICLRRPALSHLLWVIVLLKLLTPPLFEIPVGWQLDFASLPLSQTERPISAPTVIEAANSLTHSGFPASPSSSPPNSDPASVSALPEFSAPRTDEPSAANVPIVNAATLRSDSPVAATHDLIARHAIFLFSSTWIVGIVTSLLILTRRSSSFHNFIRRAGQTDKALCRRVQSLARSAGLKRSPEVIAVRGIVSPMLWGIGPRVRLIVPTTLFENLPSAACDALLLHELGHFSRGDQWVRLVELMAQVLFWWHPVVWWARHEIEAAEEQCCDAWVVQRQAGSPRTYAEALLATIDFLCEQPASLPPAASGLGGADLLRVRLTQIMRGELAASLPATAKISVFVLAAFLLPLGPALFGASIRPLPVLPPKSDKPLHEPAEANETASLPLLSPNASDQAPTVTQNATAASTNLPAVIRPAPVITAIATSSNGKYRLERRKGSHVTLVNDASNWRLDMSTHGILCVAFTPDGRQFVTGHGDGAVRVWDSETGGLVASLKGCTDAVWSLAVTQHDAERCRVAAGPKDGSVLIWDLASGDELARLPPSESSVSCLRWSSRGETLAISFGEFSNREECGLLLWRPLDNQTLAQIPLEESMAALTWLPNDEGLLMADWKGEAYEFRFISQVITPLGPLGSSGKQSAEAAHWSADCPLTTPSAAEHGIAGAQ